MPRAERSGRPRYPHGPDPRGPRRSWRGPPLPRRRRVGRRRGDARGRGLQRPRGGAAHGGRGPLPQPDRRRVPTASLIQAALAREGITDAGPRVAGIDNGFCIAFTDRTGERTFISTKGAETMVPASAWADYRAHDEPGRRPLRRRIPHGPPREQGSRCRLRCTPCPRACASCWTSPPSSESRTACRRATSSSR